MSHSPQRVVKTRIRQRGFPRALSLPRQREVARKATPSLPQRANRSSRLPPLHQSSEWQTAYHFPQQAIATLERSRHLHARYTTSLPAFSDTRMFKPPHGHASIDPPASAKPESGSVSPSALTSDSPPSSTSQTLSLLLYCTETNKPAPSSHGATGDG
ncbi:hypothetical protein BKA80DRAFT_67277 [Phyllosticta citrichinensis]